MIPVILARPDPPRPGHRNPRIPTRAPASPAPYSTPLRQPSALTPLWALRAGRNPRMWDPQTPAERDPGIGDLASSHIARFPGHPHRTHLPSRPPAHSPPSRPTEKAPVGRGCSQTRRRPGPETREPGWRCPGPTGEGSRVDTQPCGGRTDARTTHAASESYDSRARHRAEFADPRRTARARAPGRTAAADEESARDLARASWRARGKPSPMHTSRRQSGRRPCPRAEQNSA